MLETQAGGLPLIRQNPMKLDWICHAQMNMLYANPMLGPYIRLLVSSLPSLPCWCSAGSLYVFRAVCQASPTTICASGEALYFAADRKSFRTRRWRGGCQARRHSRRPTERLHLRRWASRIWPQLGPEFFPRRKRTPG